MIDPEEFNESLKAQGFMVESEQVESPPIRLSNTVTSSDELGTIATTDTVSITGNISIDWGDQSSYSTTSMGYGPLIPVTDGTYTGQKSDLDFGFPYDHQTTIPLPDPDYIPVKLPKIQKNKGFKFYDKKIMNPGWTPVFEKWDYSFYPSTEKNFARERPKILDRLAY